MKGSKRAGPWVIKVSPNASFLLFLEPLCSGSRAHLLEITGFPLLVPQTAGRRGEEIKEQRRKQKNERKPASF